MGTITTKVQITGETSKFDKAMASVRRQTDAVTKSLGNAVKNGLGGLTSGLSNITAMSADASSSMTSMAGSLAKLGPYGAAAAAAIGAIGAGISSSQTLSDMFARTWEQIKGILGTVGNAMGQFLQGNFSQAWETIKGAGEAAKQAGLLADALDDLGTRGIEWRGLQSELNAAMEEQRAIIANTANSTEKRAKAQEELNKLTAEYKQSAQAYLNAARNTYDAYAELLVKQSGLGKQFNDNDKKQIAEYLRGRNGGVTAMAALGGKWESLADTISDSQLSKLQEYRLNIFNTEQALAQMERANNKLINKDVEGKVKVKAVPDIEGIDIDFVERLNKALTDVSVSPEVLNGLLDQLTEKMMEAGTADAQAYYGSFAQALMDASDSRLQDIQALAEMESAYDAETEAISRQIEELEKLNQASEEAMEAGIAREMAVQREMEATANVIGSASDSLSAFAGDSREAAAAQKALAMAEQAAALAAAIHSAANGDPYTVAPRIAAAVAAVVAGFASLSKFANGGIVGGNSYAGDNQLVRVNSGEMILNKSQQSSLFRLLNSGVGSAGSGNVNFVITGDALQGTLDNRNRTISRLR